MRQMKRMNWNSGGDQTLKKDRNRLQLGYKCNTEVWGASSFLSFVKFIAMIVTVCIFREPCDFQTLRHKEVADLLYATPLGLTDWDIKLLLSTATEFETGRRWL